MGRKSSVWSLSFAVHVGPSGIRKASIPCTHQRPRRTGTNVNLSLAREDSHNVCLVGSRTTGDPLGAILMAMLLGSTKWPLRRTSFTLSLAPHGTQLLAPEVTPLGGRAKVIETSPAGYPMPTLLRYQYETSGR